MGMFLDKNGVARLWNRMKQYVDAHGSSFSASNILAGDNVTVERSNGNAIISATASGGGSQGITLHEHFATIASIASGATESVDIPIADLGVTDPDTIVVVSAEYNLAEFRSSWSGSESIVVGYVIRRDMGTNSYVRLIAKNNSANSYTSVNLRLVYTTL